MAARPVQPRRPAPRAMVLNTFAECDTQLQRRLKPFIRKEEFKADHKMQEIRTIVQTIRTAFTPMWTPLYQEQFWYGMVYLSLKEKPIRVFNQEQQQLAIDLGFNFITTKIQSITSHSHAKVAREMVDRVNLIEALRRAEVTTTKMINDYYGSNRLYDLWDNVTYFPNSQIQITQPVGFTWYRPLLTTKDHTDYSHLLTKWPSVKPHYPVILILGDIYQQPHEILDELSNIPFTFAILSCQVFHQTALGGKHFTDMVYYQQDGLFYQSAGPLEHEWFTTPSNQEWIQYRSYSNNVRSFVWDTYRKIEDYHVFKILPTAAPVPANSQIVDSDPRALVEMRILTPQTMSSTIQHYWVQFTNLWKMYKIPTVFNRKLFVFMPAIKKISGSQALKTRQAYQLSNLQKEVVDIIAAPKYQAFWEKIPHNVEWNQTTVVTDTVLWLFWSDFQREAQLIEGVNVNLGAEVLNFKKQRGNYQDRTQIIPWKKIAGVGLGVVLLFLLRRSYKKWAGAVVETAPIPQLTEAQQRMIQYYVQFIIFMQEFIVLYAPKYEEWAKKRWGKPMVALISIWEGLSFQNKILGLIYKIGLHVGFTKTGNPVDTHAFWNSAVWSILGMPTRGFAQATLIQNPRLQQIASAGAVLSLPVRGVTMPPGALIAQGIFTLHQTQALQTIFKWCKDKIFPSPPPHPELERFKHDYSLVTSHLTEYEGPSETSFAIPVSIENAELLAIQDAKEYSDCPVTKEAVLAQGTRASIFILLGTTQMFYRPNGPLQFWHAYKERNIKSVPISEECEKPDEMCDFANGKFTLIGECPYGKRWATLTRYVRKMFKKRVLEVEPLKSADWISHFGSALKKNRARDGIEKRNEGSIFKRTGLFLKADEVLYGRDGNLKGRTVKSLDPTIQATMYKYVDSAMKVLKLIANQKKIYELNSWLVTFTIGSGKVSSELDEWYEQSLDWVRLERAGEKRRMACIVAGDDFYALAVRNGKIVALENDFSSMDRTQGVHALEAEARILQTLGIPEEKTKILFDTMLKNPVYKAEKLGVKIKLQMPPQRATGAPDTTIGNTIINIMSVIYALNECLELEQIATAQLDLGLVAKLTIHDTPSMATFLKGWWKLTKSGGFAWLPLPSQVIKCGKIMTDPRTIFKHLDDASAWRAAAASIAASYGTVPRNYPLFGHLLHRYESLSTVIIDLTTIKDMESSSHKIQVDTEADLDSRQAASDIMERYQLSYYDLEEMVQQLLTAPFPALLTHPRWANIAVRDYG